MAEAGNTGGVAGGGVAPVTPVAGAPAVVTPPAAAAPVQTEWTTGFNDEMKGWIQNKGFKGPQDLADSYRNFEKLQGVPQDRLLKLPESMDTPEGRAIFERLGTPKDAKGYTFESLPGADPKAAEWAASEFHKLGVPKAMAEGFIKAYNAQQVAMDAEAKQAAVAAGVTAEANLKTEWGAAYEQNKSRVEQAAKVLGLTPENLVALSKSLGPEGAPKLLLKLASATAEATFIPGTPAGGNILTPEQAWSEISGLQKDVGFVSRLAKGDAEAKAKWNRLHQAASPGMVNI